MAKRVWGIVATVAGTGYLPLAPGTWASVIATMLWYVLSASILHPHYWQLLIVPVLFFAGVYCSGKILRGDEKDPSFVVIDEFAGQWLTLLFIPATLFNALAGLVLFRIFDIAKPLGIKKMEERKKGWGIMADDMLAGLYSNLILHLLLYFKLW